MRSDPVGLAQNSGDIKVESVSLRATGGEKATGLKGSEGAEHVGTRGPSCVTLLSPIRPFGKTNRRHKRTDFSILDRLRFYRFIPPGTANKEGNQLLRAFKSVRLNESFMGRSKSVNPKKRRGSV